MQIVLDPNRENGRHSEWMERTPGSYEWWYADIVSDDREWSLVTIFLLGNPFSPYYRLSAINADADPVEHNAVFVALHRASKLHHYLFSSYPASEIVSTPTIDPNLRFGPNRLSCSRDSGLTVSVDEQNSNLRRITFDVRIESNHSEFKSTTPVDPDAGHWWLPVIPSGAASVDISIRSPGSTRDVERIRFRGSGYHDHNWGILPFSDKLKSWTWARMDFGEGRSAIVYLTEDITGRQQCSLLRFAPHREATLDEFAEVEVARWGRNRFGAKYPQRVIVRSVDSTVEFSADGKLENVPFYIRYRLSAILTEAGKTALGTGIGEYFKPQIMSQAAVSWGLSRRIYRPFDGC